MMNRILCLVVLLLLSLFVALSRLVQVDAPPLCKEVTVEVIDSASYQLLTSNDVLAILNSTKLNPKGKIATSINTEMIERKIETSEFVKSADCYRTVDGDIHLVVRQRTPFFRLFMGGNSYYVDKDRTIFPVSRYAASYLSVVSGHISREMIKGDLFDFVAHVAQSSFWNAQIEQIWVEKNGDVVLIPRVGDQEIILGKPTDFKTKLDNLLLFYQEGLNRVGWGKYKTINLKYENQVVCTHR